MNITLNITVERQEGKFVSKSDIIEAILPEVEAVDLSGMGPDGTSVYEITEVDAS